MRFRSTAVPTVGSPAKQLDGRREDPQAHPMRRILRRQDKDGLGEIELARDHLHRVTIEPFGVQDDGERIAGKAPVGERRAWRSAGA